jgi:hypothetical protein
MAEDIRIDMKRLRVVARIPPGKELVGRREPPQGWR